MEFFQVDHGLDNYEELLCLSEIQFIRAGWSPPRGCQESGTWTARVVFRNGREEKIIFSESGYEELLTILEKGKRT